VDEAERRAETCGDRLEADGQLRFCVPAGHDDDDDDDGGEQKCKRQPSLRSG
jgi:hypothetical protein